MYKMKPGVVVFENMMRNLKDAAGQTVTVEYIDRGVKGAITDTLDEFAAFLFVRSAQTTLPFIGSTKAIQTISTTNGDVLYHNPLIDDDFGNPRSVKNIGELVGISDRLREKCFGREYEIRGMRMIAMLETLKKNNDNEGAAQLAKEWNDSIGC